MSKHSVAHYQRLNGRRSFSSPHRSRGRGTRVFVILILIVVAAAALTGGYLYTTPAGRPATDTTYLLVAPGSNYAELREQMQKKLWLRFPRVFDRLAAVQGLSETGDALRPGRYAVLRSTTMQELITLLKEGKDSPLKLTPPSVRKDSELVDFLAQHLWVNTRRFCAGIFSRG